MVVSDTNGRVRSPTPTSSSPPLYPRAEKSVDTGVKSVEDEDLGMYLPNKKSFRKFCF